MSSFRHEGEIKSLPGKKKKKERKKKKLREFITTRPAFKKKKKVERSSSPWNQKEKVHKTLGKVINRQNQKFSALYQNVFEHWL